MASREATRCAEAACRSAPAGSARKTVYNCILRMFKQFPAVCLLLLALSPYTAPFTVMNTGDGAQPIPSIESLSVLHSVHDPCAIMAVRSSDPYDTTIFRLLAGPALAGGCLTTFVRRSTVRTDAHGDYSPSAAILRL